MKKRWLVLLTLGSLLVTLVLHAPAARLYALVATRAEASQLQLFGLAGTLSGGSASSVSVKNRQVLKDLRWTLHPAWLALLRLSADIETGGELSSKFTVSKGLIGRLRLSDVEASGAVKSLLGASGSLTLPIEGSMHLSINSVQFDQGLPVQVDGLIEMQGLSWTLSREPLVIGDYNANLTTDDKGVLAQLASGAGPLELSGEARLTPDRSWDVNLQLKPRPDASQQMMTLVKSLGQPDGGGWYHLRRKGNL